MSYVVFFALPETEGLTAWAGVAVLVMGSFGMAAPVQGGFGAFHALVSGILVLYGSGRERRSAICYRDSRFADHHLYRAGSDCLRAYLGALSPESSG